MQGGAIVQGFGHDPSLNIMGRTGGLLGPTLAKDISSGNWPNQEYEVSSSAEPPNKNWFHVSEFIELLNQAPVTPTPTAPQPTPSSAE